MSLTNVTMEAGYDEGASMIILAVEGDTAGESVSISVEYLEAKGGKVSDKAFEADAGLCGLRNLPSSLKHLCSTS